jgi:dipeptidyl aminopeptidase/acylaminoacyl peptidase
MRGLLAAETPANKTPANKTAANDERWVRRLAGSEVETLADGSLGCVAEFRGCDGAFLPAYLRRPPSAGPHPMVLMQHGGAASEEATYTTGRSSPPAQAFAAAGCAVLATDFRHRTFPGGGVLEWHDGLASIEAARNLSFVDAGRLAIMGGSHGAHMYSEVVVRTTLRCAVLCSPAIFDLIELAKARDRGVEEVEPIKNAIMEGEKRYGATIDVVAKNPELYGYESPLTETAQVRCPILIINGRNDTSSPVAVMEAFRDKLQAAGKTVETYFPDDAPHGFYFGLGKPPRPEETAESARRATAFIRKHFA